MYKVMLVDDEQLVRFALHQIIPWRELGFEIVCEAGDGAEALALLRSRDDIDLVFVDIKMPKMNGIELLQELHRNPASQGPLWIVLSAFNEYAFVREAFLLGALDYIVKTDIDEEHLGPVVCKARGVLEERWKRGTRDSDLLSKQHGRLTDAVQRLVMQDTCASSPAYEDLVRSIAKHLGETNQLAIVYCIEHAAEWHRDTFPWDYLEQTIRTVFESVMIPQLSCRLDPHHYVVLCTVPEERSELNIRQTIDTALRISQTRLKLYVNVQTAIGISDPMNGRRHWRALVTQAQHLASLVYYEGFNRLIYPEGKQMLKEEGDDTPEYKEVTAMLTELRSSLVQQEAISFEMQIERLTRLLTQFKAFHPNLVRSLLTDVIWEWGGLLYKQGIRWEDLSKQGKDPFEFIKRAQTLDSTMQWLKEQGLRVKQAISQQSKHRQHYSPAVWKAKQYLDNHYTEEIHLTMVCHIVGVTESYLSKQFAKEVGCTFIQYITQLRIEESKRLLRLDMKITDICERIGYLNPEHFSRIFKKATGFSPRAYRESVL